MTDTRPDPFPMIGDCLGVTVDEAYRMTQGTVRRGHAGTRSRHIRLGERLPRIGPRAGSSGLVSLSGYLDGRCHGDMRSEQWLTWADAGPGRGRTGPMSRLAGTDVTAFRGDVTGAVTSEGGRRYGA
ncbi:MAG: hypothetical protein JWP40_3443 [Blastococcus sp.]|nr:hypothetical protein [Blastococcus sp.]